MGRIASDGSEGSEGKEGGTDRNLFDFMPVQHCEYTPALPKNMGEEGCLFRSEGLPHRSQIGDIFRF
jgi:hypothetical protein